MNLALLLGITLLPTGFWLWLFVRRDAHPEPPGLLLRTFAYGSLAWALSAALELGLSAIAGAAGILILGALVEEGAKLLAASTAAYEREFDEPMDGLIYAVMAALGFSLPENLAYGLQYGAEVAVWHSVVTTLAHALFSAPLGYGLARARFSRNPRWLVYGLLTASALHVVFNGLLTEVSGWWPLPLLVLTLLLLFLLVDRLYARWRADQRAGR